MFRRFSCLLLMQNYEIQLLYVYVWKKSWTYIFRLIKLQYKNFFFSHSKSHSFYSSLLFANKCCSSPFNANAMENVWCDYESFSQWSTNSIFICLFYFVFFSLFHVQRIEFAEWLYATRKSILIGSSRVPVRHSWILLIH